MEELWPHGRRINMGAYGGTAEASMLFLTVGHKCDLNHDDVVRSNDFWATKSLRHENFFDTD